MLDTHSSSELLANVNTGPTGSNTKSQASIVGANATAVKLNDRYALNRSPEEMLMSGAIEHASNLTNK